MVPRDVGLVVDEVEVERADDDRGRRRLVGLRPPVAQRGADPGLELGHAERLGHVVVRPAVEGGHFAVLVAAGRQDDDGHLAPLPDPPAYRLPVDVGQPEIEHDDVGGGQRRLGDPLLAVGRGDHLVAAGLQTEAQGPQQGGIVIDDEHFGHGRYRPTPTVAATGKVKANRAPTPDTSSTQMCSPWASTNVLAMVSPSPARPPVSNRT